MRHTPLPNHFYVWADKRYLTEGKEEGNTPAVLHSVYGRPGQVLLTHLLLESGAHWSGVPLFAIFHKPHARMPHLALGRCQPWGNMGEDIEAIHMPYLEGLQISLRGDRGGRSTGTIIDWRDGFTRHPDMHKPLHLLTMDDGTFALQPNNHIRWRDPSFVVEGRWEETTAYRRGSETWWPEDKQ